VDRGRISAAIPDVEMRPETETRPKPEVDNPTEIQVSMSAICEEGLGATKSYILEIIQYVTADRPETLNDNVQCSGDEDMSNVIYLQQHISCCSYSFNPLSSAENAMDSDTKYKLLQGRI